jgi:hypothetical protein
VGPKDDPSILRVMVKKHLTCKYLSTKVDTGQSQRELKLEFARQLMLVSRCTVDSWFVSSEFSSDIWAGKGVFHEVEESSLDLN